jgi:type VII secretion integral membrane protein EccD
MTAVSPAAQATDAPRLGKVSLLVGDDTLIDYVLPAGVALIAVIEDLIPRVNAILRKRNAPELDDKLTYRLCRTDATPLDVQRSLDDSGVLDGEVLWLLPADATERYAQTVEEVSTALARSADEQFRRVDVTTTRRVAGGLAVGVVAWAELMLGQLWWQRHGWVPAAVSGALTVVLLVAARGLGRARDEHRRATAIMLVWAALIAAGAAAALAVPGPPGGWHLVAAIAVVLAGL